MKAQRPLGLALSWSWITSVFVIDIGVLALAHRLSAPGRPTAWWLGVAAAALVTIATLLTYRGITVASALARWVWDWSADLWESSPDSGATLSPGCTPGIDHRHRFGRDVVGVRQHQGHLVAVVAIVEAQPPSGLPEGEAAPPATVPVPLIAAGLRQFDVRLDAIDIVSVRKRQDREAADPSASPPVDDHTAGIERGTWLVIRMNPQRNVGAVAARDSVVSTVAAVAERLAGVVDGQRCAARPLTADELAEVDTAVMAGLDPTRTRPGLRHLKHFDGYATSFWVSPWDITSDTLDRLWLLDTDATVVTIRLAAANGRAEVSAWVRYHSSERLGKDVGAGLNHLAGRQLTAVQASLPAPAKRPPLVVPARALDEDDYDLAVRVTPMDAAAPEQPMDPVPQEAMDHTQDSDNARPEPAVATAM
ncbi:type VII secretion protein EccE [Mycobacterium palustre]|uniref:type VII secretion protein EccE n=1 Tax=Mycobacterium palustre TaxID=153971 RepID=UPI000A168113|nr:type VII secretion protein EccE [Mycobacterium palustre]MCV7099768.1 type VII secretion protein EccE [Mycobacterium palustre]